MGERCGEGGAWEMRGARDSDEGWSLGNVGEILEILGKLVRLVK